MQGEPAAKRQAIDPRVLVQQVPYQPSPQMQQLNALPPGMTGVMAALNPQQQHMSLMMQLQQQRQVRVATTGVGRASYSRVLHVATVGLAAGHL
jgi:hypothetical protein